MKSINRRETPRIDVKLKCHISSPQVWSGGTVAVTENISRGGILLHWNGQEDGSRLPRLGDLIILDIELPLSLPGSQSFQAKCIHTQGTVVRVEDVRDKATKVALSVNYMKFHNFGKRMDLPKDSDA
jgi:c-di-GMP-binding flagellar brake protein YcgR